MSTQDEQAVQVLSPYGYRLAGTDQPQAFVPLTADPPGASRLANGWNNPPADAYAGSGQPVGPELWRRVLESADTPEGRAVLKALVGRDFGDDEPNGRIYDGTIGAAADPSTGNVSVRLFEVPAGAVAKVVRVVVEAQGFTPASTYTNAGAWHALVAAPSGTVIQSPTTVFGSGMVRDFGPPTPGGPLLPALFVDNDDQAAAIRGRTLWYVLAGNSGAIAGKQLAISYRVNVRAA